MEAEQAALEAEVAAASGAAAEAGIGIVWGSTSASRLASCPQTAGIDLQRAESESWRSMHERANLEVDAPEIPLPRWRSMHRPSGQERVRGGTGPGAMAAGRHVPTELLRVERQCTDGDFTMPRLRLKDRRARGEPVLAWVYQRHLESALYNRAADGGSSGAIWKLLNKCGLGSAALHVNGAAVATKQVTQDEYDEIVARFKLSTAGLDPCSVGRVRSVTLLPMAAAAAVARTFGHTTSSLSFLRATSQPVPRAWELEEQREKDEANGEVDLVLEEQIDAERADHELDATSFAEELTSMAPFETKAEDEVKMTQYSLRSVPAVLKRQLDAYVANRTAVFSGRRHGGAVVSSTAEHDTKVLLRFFGWMDATHRAPPVGSFDVDFLARPDLGDVAQAFAEWLSGVQGLRMSSIANYLNSLIALTAYVYSERPVPAATAAMDPSPLSMVINLRRQAEASSATESLFHKRVGGWIEWDDVHKARRTAMERLRAHAGDYAGKRALLRDAAAISLLSLIPPDRVGLIRKLRLGHTLKRAARGGWRLDLTKQKDGHKTSRFYGPFAAQLPRQLDSVLDAYAAALSVDSPDAEEAYLFHPASGDLTRPLDSSAWTAFVRRLFGRLHGSEVAPKTLRSSFITWLRATTDAPEVRRRPARRPCPPPVPPSRHPRLNFDFVIPCLSFARREGLALSGLAAFCSPSPIFECK